MSRRDLEVFFFGTAIGGVSRFLKAAPSGPPDEFGYLTEKAAPGKRDGIGNRRETAAMAEG